MTNRLDIGPIHRLIEEHLRPLTVALYERTGIEPHLTLGVSRALGPRMQMLPGQQVELLTEAGVVTVSVAEEGLRERIRELEQETAELTARLAASRERVAELHDRLR